MKWWTRSSLRTRIFLAFAALVLAVLVAALGFTQLILSRQAQRAVSQDLLTTGQVFDDLLTERAGQLTANSTLLASDFALKRVIATQYDTESFDPQTIASAAVNYQRRIGVELLWITDETGELLTEGAAPPGTESRAGFSPLEEAVVTERATTAIAEVGGTLYQLVAVPVLAPDVIGFLVLGRTIDDAFAKRLQANTGSHISFVAGSRVFASSWPKDLRGGAVSAAGGRALPIAPDPAPSIRSVNGERFLSLVSPLEARLDDPLFAIVQGSYDEALAPLRELQRRIVLIGVAALAGALLAGGLLAGGIIAPVRSLVAGMREVIKGNLRYRSTIAREDEIGFLARSFNEMVGGLEERERIKDTFGRFVSRDVADVVLGGRVPLEGECREVSILFQDIRGFTALSRELDPATLLRLLNQLFTQAVAAVEAEGGVVKQFTGDGVMALFGAPYAYADHAERATRAALGIVRRLEGLNEDLQRQGLPALAIGVGIHMGNVVAGLIGPDKRVEYGVVGEAVNLASRVESLTKEMQAVVLVSREIAERLGGNFTLGRSALLPVKGSAQGIHVVEVLAHEPAPASPGEVEPVAVARQPPASSAG